MDLPSSSPRTSGLLLVALALLSAPAASLAQEPATGHGAAAGGDVPAWGLREARHLWNRAGFGADREDIERAVALGRDAFVAELLATDDFFDEPFYARVKSQRKAREDGKEKMAPEERREAKLMMRREDRAQLDDFLGWWVERMVRGEDPLRERMTLFWHGYFTSSMDDVKDSYEMIRQNQLLRSNALAGFRDLLRGIARDPAMLEYLDNDSNKAGNPNENFARELLELFTLGEGNYTEQDVKGVARAFTGWTDRDGKYRFNRRQHDGGVKTVLGVTGDLDGDDVIDLILQQEACRNHLAAKLIRYFEGVEPTPGRLAEYAAFLGESDYDVGGFLAKLFRDPAFYREEVVGARIAGPVDYLVGCARRLGIEPPPDLVVLGSALLGQNLFRPPNVKGWEGGESWITTASLIQRANLAGVLLGEVSVDDFLDYDPLQDPDLDASMDGMGGVSEEAGMSGPPVGEPDSKRDLGRLRELKKFRDEGWTNRINLTARMKRAEARSDGKIVRTMLEDLLAIEVPKETRRSLVGRLRAEREAAGIEPNKLLAEPAVCEPILRRLAHVIYSLPEAQLD